MNKITSTENNILAWADLFTPLTLKSAIEGDNKEISLSAIDDLKEYFPEANKENATETIKQSAKLMIESVAKTLSTSDLGLTLASVRCIEPSETFTESLYVFAAPISNVLFETFLVFESNESTAYSIIADYINENETEEDAQYIIETLIFAGAITPEQ